MTSESTDMAALLVVDSIDRDASNPDRTIARIRLAGHPLAVVLDFSRRALGFAEHVEVPALLGAHAPSQKAVVELMAAADAGNPISLPVDLSDRVRSATPPFPFVPLPVSERERLESAADQVRLEVVDLERRGSEPATFTGHLRVNGKPIRLVVELYAGTNRVTIMRWLGGSDRDQLSPAESFAVQRELLKR